MTERNVYSTDGCLTVQREIDGSNKLVEVWKIRSMWWRDYEEGDEPIVRLSICEVNDTATDAGVPLDKSRRVDDSMPWSEVPEEVRKKFDKQVDSLVEMTTLLNPKI